MSETRYVVEWTPWKLVSAAAAKRGWTKAESVFDFVETENFTQREVFPTFAAALRRARIVEIHDTWGSPRIEREVLSGDDEWEADARWEVFQDEADPSEDTPDVDLMRLVA